MALGQAKYRAYLYDRGGKKRVMELPSKEMVRWTRKRDDISTAEVHINAKSHAEARAIGDVVATGRMELVIYRGRARVWEGPIIRTAMRGRSISIYARDVMHYVYRTIMRAAYDNSGPNAAAVLTRVQTIFTAELARKEALVPPINVLPHVQFITRPTDARTSRRTVARQSTVWEDLDSLAHRSGVDYVTVGRRIVLWDTDWGLTRIPVVTEKDFIGEVIITEYGMDLATETTVTDGQGNWATAGGTDPYYGLIEMLHTAYDEADGGPLPTTVEMQSQADRNLTGRNPVPVEVRVPDGSQINPRGVWTLEHLVPGVHIPLRATTAARDITQVQKLDEVRVDVSAEGETISVSMSPAASNNDGEE